MDPETGRYLPSETRDFQADVYVFALHGARTHDQYDALDLAQWSFHGLSRSQITELPQGAKGHALATLRRIRDISASVGFQTLAEEICKAGRSCH